MSKIGKNIRKIRVTKGLSQTEFANLFNISRARVGAYEELRAEPKTETLLQIAKHFSIPLETLLNEELTVNQLTNFSLPNTYTSNQPKSQYNAFIIEQNNWSAFKSDPSAFAANATKPPSHLGEYLFDANLFSPLNHSPSSYICSLVSVAEPAHSYIVITNNQLQVLTFEELALNQKPLFKIKQTLTTYEHNYLAKLSERITQLEQRLKATK